MKLHMHRWHCCAESTSKCFVVDKLMQFQAELDTKMAEQKEREVIEVQKGPAAQQANPTYAVPEVDGKQGPTGQEPQPAEEEAEQQLEPSSSDGTHAADSEALGGIFPIVDTTQPPGSGSARDASPSSCSSSEAAGNARTTSEARTGNVSWDCGRAWVLSSISKRLHNVLCCRKVCKYDLYNFYWFSCSARVLPGPTGDTCLALVPFTQCHAHMPAVQTCVI